MNQILESNNSWEVDMSLNELYQIINLSFISFYDAFFLSLHFVSKLHIHLIRRDLSSKKGSILGMTLNWIWQWGSS